MHDRPLPLGALLPALLLFAVVFHWGLVGATVGASDDTAPDAGRTQQMAHQEAAFVVQGDELIGSVTHEAEAMWDRFVELVPPEHRATVGRFSVFGDDDKDAYVEQLHDDVTKWHLALNEDLATRRHLLDRTLVHELGHLVSFDPEQVPPVATDRAWYLASRECHTYMAREGCSSVGSYMNEFVSEFWEGELLDEWQQIAAIGDDERRMSEIQAFATSHNERFVSEYAGTNPEEDLAESFAAYVLGNDVPSEGTVGDRISFFTRFPELVTLRETIRDNR